MPVRRSLALAFAVLALLCGVAVGVSTAKEPRFPATPAEIVAYNDSGEWTATITKQVRRAKRFVRSWLASHPRPRKRKPAAVLDIDDTSVSLYPCAKAVNFDARTLACAITPPPPAIPQVLSFYRFARKHRVAVFFVTGRPEAIQALTVTRLAELGYSGRLRTYFKPPTYQGASVVPYKRGARRDVTKKGFRILANIGDQRSDLQGGYALRTYKLPNPMYLTP